MYLLGRSGGHGWRRFGRGTFQGKGCLVRKGRVEVGGCLTGSVVCRLLLHRQWWIHLRESVSIGVVCIEQGNKRSTSDIEFQHSQPRLINIQSFHQFLPSLVKVLARRCDNRRLSSLQDSSSKREANAPRGRRYHGPWRHREHSIVLIRTSLQLRL